MTEACETCRFSHIVWRAGDEYYPYHGGYYSATPQTPSKRDRTAVLCRRYAPRMASMENQQDGWPMIDAADWCGEFKPKENNNAE